MRLFFLTFLSLVLTSLGSKWERVDDLVLHEQDNVGGSVINVDSDELVDIRVNASAVCLIGWLVGPHWDSDPLTCAFKVCLDGVCNTYYSNTLSDGGVLEANTILFTNRNEGKHTIEVKYLEGVVTSATIELRRRTIEEEGLWGKIKVEVIAAICASLFSTILGVGIYYCRKNRVSKTEEDIVSFNNI